MKIPIFPGKYHQNGGFSWAMLVYRRVPQIISWRIIPGLVSGWLPPFKNWKENNPRNRGLTITMVAKYLLTGMILQVGFAVPGVMCVLCKRIC